MKKISIEKAINDIRKFYKEIDTLNREKDDFEVILPLENNQGIIFEVGPDDDGERTVNITVSRKVYLMPKLKDTVLDWLLEES